MGKDSFQARSKSSLKTWQSSLDAKLASEEMTKPIKYLEGIVFVDDEAKIKEGDKVYSLTSHEIITWWLGKSLSDKRKLISQSPNLNIEGIPYAEVEEYESIEDLKHTPARSTFQGTPCFAQERLAYDCGFRDGYKAAQPKQPNQSSLRKRIWLYYQLIL